MSRRRRRSARNNRGLLAISFGVLLILAMGAAGAYLNFGKRSTDRLTGCPVDRYDDVTAVLVDQTDMISPVQAVALNNALLTIRNEVPKFGRLEIYSLRSTDEAALEPLFAGCSPGSGREVDSRLYGNPELADRIWKEKFADAVDAVIKKLRTVDPQGSSPLFEGIQSVAVTAFGSPLGSSATSKRLVLVSDMIHHTKEMSLYTGASEFVALEKTPYYPIIKPRLRGADVHIFLIVRQTSGDVQKPNLYKFWVEFLDAGGGYLRLWEPLQ